MTDNTPWRIFKSNLDFVEKIVGHQWLEDWVHKMRNNFGRVGQDVPPLAFRWLKAKDELAAAEFTGNLTLSLATLYTIQLGQYMEILYDTPGFANQLPRLKNTADFYNGYFCLAVAATYRQMGYSLTFSMGQHKQDFQLHNTQGAIPVATQTVTANSFDQLLTSLPDNLAKALAKLPEQGIIYLELPLPPEHIASLLPKIKDACTNGQLSIPKHTAVVLASAIPRNHAPWGVKYIYSPLLNEKIYADLILPKQSE